MTIEVHCECGHALRVRDEFLGRRVRCPSCRQPVLIEQSAGVPSFDFVTEAADPPPVPAEPATEEPAFPDFNAPAPNVGPPDISASIGKKSKRKKRSNASADEVDHAQVSILAGLFDFSFSKFITISVVKVIYVLSLVLSSLFAVIGILVGFSQSPQQGIVSLIVIPIVFFLNVLVLRVTLEMIVIIFRIKENTDRLDE